MSFIFIGCCKYCRKRHGTLTIAVKLTTKMSDFDKPQQLANKLATMNCNCKKENNE